MRFRIPAALASLLLASTLILPCAAIAADEAKPGDAPPAAAPAPAPERKMRKPRARVAPVERSAWMFGFGFGWGWGAPSFDKLEPSQETGSTVQFRLGYAAAPKMVAGVEWLSWSATADTNSWKLQAVGPSLTYYFSKSGYVRGAAGFGIADVAIDAADPAAAPGSPLVHYHRSDDGFMLLAAAGYEWRLLRHLGVSPEVQWLRVNAGDDLKGRMFGAGIQFNYFY